MNLNRFTIKDSDDQESKILGMSFITWVVGTVAFVAGIWLGEGGQPMFSLLEYGGFSTAIIGVVTARKWVKTSAAAKVKAASVVAKAEVEAAKVAKEEA